MELSPLSLFKCCMCNGRKDAQEHQGLLQWQYDSDCDVDRRPTSPRWSTADVQPWLVRHSCYSPPWYPAALAGDQQEARLVTNRPSVNVFVEAGNTAVEASCLSATKWKAILPHEPVMFAKHFANAPVGEWHAFMGDGLEDPIIACAVSKGKDLWAVCVLGTGFTPATFAVVDVDNEEAFTRSLHSPCAMCLEANGDSVTEIVPVLLGDLGCSSGAMRHLYPCPAAFVQDFAKLAKQTNIPETHKAGVLLICEGQQTENEWLSNVSTPAFERFLHRLGDKVSLEGFQGYRGGLDVNTNTTGTESVHLAYHGRELMFHVSTMLPYSESDSQQLARKRHIGNDIVVILFKDSSEAIDPILRSQYNHVFIVVIFFLLPIPTAFHVGGSGAASAWRDGVFGGRGGRRMLPPRCPVGRIAAVAVLVLRCCCR